MAEMCVCIHILVLALVSITRVREARQKEASDEGVGRRSEGNTMDADGQDALRVHEGMVKQDMN